MFRKVSYLKINLLFPSSEQVSHNQLNEFWIFWLSFLPIVYWVEYFMWYNVAKILISNALKAQQNVNKNFVYVLTRTVAIQRYLFGHCLENFARASKAINVHKMYTHVYKIPENQPWRRYIAFQFQIYSKKYYSKITSIWIW